MENTLPDDWLPWRSEPPLRGRRPTKTDLAEAAAQQMSPEDLLPYPVDEDNAGLLRMLIVGTNPSPWAAAANGPFGRPGNRFWASLHEAGVTTNLVNASAGISRADERMLAERGVGLTNIIGRPTARADQLSLEELRAGREALVERMRRLQPRVAAFTGITAFRRAFTEPKATLGLQPTDKLDGWPVETLLWVVPDPSGLNAHESIASLAEKWLEVWSASGR